MLCASTIGSSATAVQPGMLSCGECCSTGEFRDVVAIEIRGWVYVGNQAVHRSTQLKLRRRLFIHKYRIGSVRDNMPTWIGLGKGELKIDAHRVLAMHPPRAAPSAEPVKCKRKTKEKRAANPRSRIFIHALSYSYCSWRIATNDPKLSVRHSTIDPDRYRSLP